jgi:hypothetical protein
MDFAKFVDILENERLWFSSVSQFKDPLEGTHTDAELESLRKTFETAEAEDYIKLSRQTRRMFYVSCWHFGSSESLAMWDLYGKGIGIVAIKSSIGRFKQAIAGCERNIFISNTKYVDWDAASGSRNLLVTCSRKDVSYCQLRLMCIS